MFLLYLGNINSINSVGTNDLIKQGAKLVTNYKEIYQGYIKNRKTIDMLKKTCYTKKVIVKIK